MVHLRAGRAAEAAVCCFAILEHDPKLFDALHLLGVLCLRRHSFADALGFFHRAVQVRTDVAQLHGNLGRAYLGLASYGEAEIWFRSAMGARPDPALLSDLGAAVAGAGRHASAEAMFRQALVLAPGFQAAEYNLARCLAAQGRHAEAAALFRTLLDRLGSDPRRQELVTSGLAASLSALERYEDALAACRELLRSQPHSASGRWNASLALLSLGRYAEGWAAYECRSQVAAHERPHPRASVLDLAAVDGRSVLLVAEQGRGDSLQFARYAPLLAGLGAEVTLQVPADVAPVLRAMPGVAVISLQDAEPRTEYVTSLLSLPLAFGTTIETIPAATPYLAAPPDRLALWRERLGDRRGPRVGLSWRGLQHIPRRSVPVGALGLLLQLDGVALHALQKDITPTDQDWLDRNGVPSYSAALLDFGDTAALVSLMDVVVTIDTSVAHLAGGLGAPVCVMLPFDADWRWLRGREDTPWYPTARLFRQVTPGDWSDVVGRIAAALAGVFGAAASRP